MVESILKGLESFINKYLKTIPFIIFQCVFCSLCNLIVVGGRCVKKRGLVFYIKFVRN